MMLVFVVTVFLGAGLLFLVQPMVAKMVLPLYGGSPQVWNTSMLFFQGVLLAGYGASHVISSRLGPRRHAQLQLLLLAIPIVALPIALPTFAVPEEGIAPAAWLLLVLGVSVALPFFVVSMTSPTLQRWFAATDHAAAGDPYFLYAAGNAGSLLALIAYPFVVEPNLAASDQTRLWAGGYIVYAVLFAACASLMVRRAGARSLDRAASPTDASAASIIRGSARVDRAAAHAPVTQRRRLWWVLLAFVPSSLMLGVTSYLTTDIAAVPLLWVIPLSVYLLTFIIAFSTRFTISPRLAGAVLAVVVAALTLATLRVVALPVVLEMALHLISLFCAGLLAHGRLAADRPHPSRLTEYFLLVSFGGVLGGIFNALIAPVVFEVVLEYVIAIVLALMLRHGLDADRPAATGRGARGSGPRGPRRLAWTLDYVIPLLLFIATLVALVLTARIGDADGTLARIVLLLALAATIVLSIRRPVRYALGVGALLAIGLLAGRPALYTDRTFFGLNRVLIDDAGRHQLAHGTTIHGGQWADDERASEPLAYYHRSGPAGQVFEALDGDWRHAAVIGLGAGSMAAYGASGQRMTFYEIDTAVADIATNPDFFTFLRDSHANVEIVLGDGRLTIAEAPDGGFDIIFMDAFSSDSPPVHLLTREALRLYLDKLAPGGLIVFNVSNRYLDLATVVARQASDAGLAGLVQVDDRLDEAPPGDKEASQFIVLARDAASLEPVAANGRWLPIGDPAGRVWTDDYSDVIGALRAW